MSDNDSIEGSRSRASNITHRFKSYSNKLKTSFCAQGFLKKSTKKKDQKLYSQLLTKTTDEDE
jgi:hypothetical protein